MSTKFLDTTYIQLIRNMQDDPFATAIERPATYIELADGRRGSKPTKMSGCERVAENEHQTDIVILHLAMMVFFT